MFKNFGKVLKFTFKNMADTMTFKIMTIVVALILLIVPSIVFMIMGANEKKDDKETLESCGIESFYVVNKISDSYVDFNALNYLNVDGYNNIKYINEENVDVALRHASENVAQGMKTAVLVFSKEENGFVSEIITPDDLDAPDVNNFNTFLTQYESPIAIMASGLSIEQIGIVATSSQVKTYNETGFNSGVSKDDELSNGKQDVMDSFIRDKIIEVLKFIIPFINLIVFYFMVLLYCQSVSQSLVLEKQNKLMDTILVSIKPEALAAGKVLGLNLAAIAQIVIWTISCFVGFGAAMLITEHFYPDNNLIAIYFIKHMMEYDLFKPLNVLAGIVILVLGFMLYSALAAIGGSISTTREEAANSSYIYIFVLLASYFGVLYGGVLSGGDCALWTAAIPFTAPLVVPGYAILGGISSTYLIISLVTTVVVTVALVFASGRLYTTTSLYKGNKITLAKMLKTIFTGEL